MSAVSQERTPLRRFLAAVVVAILLLCLGIGYLLYRWNSADALVRRLENDGGYVVTPADTDTLYHYFGGSILTVPPWHKLSIADERRLIAASLKQIESHGDPTLLYIVTVCWDKYHDFKDLPSMASQFLDRRDNAAGTVLASLEGPHPGTLLNATRVRELLQNPADQQFQVALLVTIDPSLFPRTIDDWEAARDRGMLSKKTLDVLERRLRELNIASQPN